MAGTFSRFFPAYPYPQPPITVHQHLHFFVVVQNKEYVIFWPKLEKKKKFDNDIFSSLSKMLSTTSV